jgi:hypothetical protein
MKTSRRHFMVLGAVGLLRWDVCFGLQASGIHNASQSSSQQHPSADEWMNAWMTSPNRGEEGGLYLFRFADPIYVVTKPITWKPNPDQRGYQSVVVPFGFVSDLASVPQLFWDLLRPDGEYAYAAIIHDYLYWEQTCPRETADTIFKFVMVDFGIGRPTIEAIYRAVRCCGGPAWNKNQKDKRDGQRRILKKFPDKPQTRWEKWKDEPDVFAEQ